MRLPILVVTLILFIYACQTESEAHQEQVALPTQLQIAHIDTIPFTSSIRALEVVDDHTIWWAGSKGKYGYSLDGGQNWTVDSLLWDTLQPHFRSLAVTREAVFLLSIASPALLFRSTDRGQNWELVYQEEHPAAFYDAMAFWDDQHGIAMGDPTDGCLSVIRTMDGGQSWEEVEAPAIRDDEYHFNALLQLGDGSFFVVGEIGMMGWSADGGEWMRLQAPYEGTLFGAVARGRRGAIIYGLRGNVYLTDDVNSGEWTKIETNSVQSMYGGTILPNGNPAMVGLNGSVMVLRPDGSVQLDKVESIAGTLGSGTLANAVPWEDGLIAVGELGVSSVQLDR